MKQTLPQFENPAYTVGLIAAHPHERAAVEAMLDQKHAPPQYIHPHDHNIYTLGAIKGSPGYHKVVVVSPPAGRYGPMTATATVAKLLSSFPGIKYGVTVGTGGGIPDADSGSDIRLGDVVVGRPEGAYWGVREYDIGKARPTGPEKGSGWPYPPTALLGAVSAIRSKHELTGSDVPKILAAMGRHNPRMGSPQPGQVKRQGFVYPGAENDFLFDGQYEHRQGSADCRGCDPGKLVYRVKREHHDPLIFYGTIASAKTVVNNARQRDTFKDCLCFESDAAEYMNSFPCLVVRGISDYCDSHKNNRWQMYAAATAAAYAKELLGIMHAGSEWIHIQQQQKEKPSCCIM
ncbi:hypothetical protein ASPVEDRAFT_42832 [Aspergillus versicolor CBS 583.65]|uniref:Nucleoside phosphorylase domain-containing protein n=1 Tax=Aspergillus versicolor CBS 583.65 TaxID=1036611 RepID=A0A1L9PP53_ASPVE|nr:uncharacterized protein ASPVEDRAFT_42832 [Aspergillus versicolor CBS 583.65]OJJ03314.1 hypothetical protein ASPVEDRAFT_42832 [Aspergillus versicolor CBS 583.65]